MVLLFDRVFVKESREPIVTGTPTHLFRKVIKEAGLRETRLHDLRHFHSIELLRLGEPLHVVSDHLGHKDPIVTATIYAHVTNEQREKARLILSPMFQRARANSLGC